MPHRAMAAMDAERDDEQCRVVTEITQHNAGSRISMIPERTERESEGSGMLLGRWGRVLESHPCKAEVACWRITVLQMIRETVIRIYGHMIRVAIVGEGIRGWTIRCWRGVNPSLRVIEALGRKDPRALRGSYMVARSMVEDSRTVGNNPRRSE